VFTKIGSLHISSKSFGPITVISVFGGVVGIALVARRKIK